MTQTIDDIIARFGQEGWLVQKTDKNYWTVRPRGLYDYKLYLLVYNPFNDKFQLVPPPMPNDPHYERALKILGASDRRSGEISDRIESAIFPELQLTAEQVFAPGK